MNTWKYRSTLGGDKTSSNRWIGPKGQTALALAVSLWIGGSGVAWAEEVTVLNEESVAYINCSGDENTITVESGGSVTGEHAGAGITGGENNNQLTIEGTVVKKVYGGKSEDNEVTGNNIIISGNGQVKDYVHGGYSLNNVVKDNHVTLKDSGKVVNAAIYGGEVDNANAENNTVTIEGGTVENNGVYGGRADYGTAKYNKVTISGGTVGYSAHGGYSPFDKAIHNTVTISNGTINHDVFGGRAKLEASNNVVDISGGKMGGSSYGVYGGKSDSGKAMENTVTISGGTIYSPVYGGNAKLEASDNVVTIKGGTLNKQVYGGYSDSGLATNNKVTISGGEVGENVYGGKSDNGSATGNTVTITDGTVGAEFKKVYGGEGKTGASGNKVTISGGTINGGVSGGESSNGHAVGNEVHIQDVTIEGQVYGGYTSSSDATSNTVTLTRSTVNSSVYGGYVNNDTATRKATGNTIKMTGSTVTGSVVGGSGGGDYTTGNTLHLSGANTVTGTVENYAAIKLMDSLAWDTTKPVLTAGSFSNYGGLDITAATKLNATTTPGTMTLLQSGTANDFATLNLTYKNGTSSSTVDLSSTKTSQVVKSGTAKTSADKGITIAYNENEHTVSLDAANSYKNVNYTIANKANSITLGNMTWGTSRVLAAGAFDFSNITNDNINVADLKFANPESLTSSTPQTALLQGAIGLAAGAAIAHTQNFTTKANGATLSATLSGNVIRPETALGYKVTGTALNGVNLTGWNGTASSVPMGWTSGLTPNSITAAGFTAPTIDPGTSTNILTTNTNEFFEDTQITGAMKYALQASSSDTVSGVTLTGAESKGVKVENSGKSLVYARSNFNISNVSLGTMTWGTGRTADAAGYVYTGAKVDASGLSFKNPQNITAGSTTLLTANNTLTDITATTKNVSYSAVPIAGVTLDGVINGSYASTSGVLSYTATANNATKLTFGNVEWKDEGDALIKHATDTTKNINFAGAAVDTSNINFTNIKELEAHKQMTLVSNFGDTVGTITGTKYKVGSTLQGEGKASLVDSNDDGTMDALIFTTDTRAEKMTVQEQTHNTVMGAEVGMAALSAGNDFVGAATEGLSMAGNTGTDGMATYANMGGGSMNVETGSHVKTHTWNAILALGHKNEKKLSTIEYGAFFEYGTGNYSTFNGDERGDGSTRYTGGGILGKWQKNNGFYVEGSLRAGSIHDDANNVLRDANGNPYSYTTDATYWGAHIGVGREIKLNKTDVLDLYAKYFYNHRGSVSFDAGGHYDLGAVESSVLRVGTRYTVKQNDNIHYYGGLAVEHEFCGRASGFADGVAIRGADISGTSVRGEIGATFRPGDKSNVTLDLNLSGFAGKKEGLTGGLSAVFHI